MGLIKIFIGILSSCISLHGSPRSWGAAVASCIFGATGSCHGSLAAAALIEFTEPISAIGAILAGIDCTGLDHVMVFACGEFLWLNQVFAFWVYSYGTRQNACKFNLYLSHLFFFWWIQCIPFQPFKNNI